MCITVERSIFHRSAASRWAAAGPLGAQVGWGVTP
jgi:hypothetical protein